MWGVVRRPGEFRVIEVDLLLELVAVVGDVRGCRDALRGALVLGE